MTTLTVIQGGRNQAEIIQVERRTWDELRMSLAVATSERLSASTQTRQLMLRALFALGRPEPDVEAAERALTAALRVVTQEATRAAADHQPAPEPTTAVSAAERAA